jgi:adenosylcobinamide-GDP ribazoletransferase
MDPVRGPEKAGPLLHPGDLGAAVTLLTRLPWPLPAAHARGARAAWAWPLAGALVALLAWGAGALLLWAGLPPAIAAGGALAAAIVVTGALHEDGLADCADGFWGGATRERRLEILRDSRIGSYGVVALVLVIGMRWIALAALFDAGGALAALIAVAMVSRGAMAGVMAALPFAREDGLAVHVGRPSRATAGTAGIVALVGTVLAVGFPGLAVAVLGALAAGALALLAHAKVGGQTGDVLGAAQQAAELVALLACVALLA